MMFTRVKEQLLFLPYLYGIGKMFFKYWPLPLIFILATAEGSSSDARENQLVIALVGDSTVTSRAGWGKAFADRFDNRVKLINFAVGGRSSKSFYNENRLPDVLASKPDYVFIQFGHNDQPGKGPDRETDPSSTFRDYLRLYVKEFQSIGAKPILLSSVTRRTFDAQY